MLGPLGLKPSEEAIYRDLITTRVTSIEETSARMNMSVAVATLALRVLQSRGLANETAEPGSFVAVPPSISLRSALIAQEKSLRDFEAEMSRLDLVHRSNFSESSAVDGDRYISDDPAVKSLTLELLRSARKTVRIAVRIGSDRWTEAELAAQLDGSGRAVVARSLVEADALAEQRLYLAADRLTASDSETRVIGKIASEVLIVDSSIALLRILGDRRDTEQYVLVRNEVWVQTLEQGFDVSWAMSYPFRHEISAGEVLSSLEKRILALQLSGMTDRAIGSQLKLSERSVQRYVSRLMERANAKSRIQLGWYARHHGWVTIDG